MSKIRMLRNLLGVEKLGKSTGKDASGIFASAEATFNLGVVRYVGESLGDKFTVGEKIYFGNVREQIQMAGADIMVMQEDNVYAKVEDVQ